MMFYARFLLKLVVSPHNIRLLAKRSKDRMLLRMLCCDDDDLMPLTALIDRQNIDLIAKIRMEHLVPVHNSHDSFLTSSKNTSGSFI